MGRAGRERICPRAVEPRTDQARGAAHGQALEAAGVNVDLAPVADVAATGSFMAADQRTFGATSSVVGRAVVSFVRGLGDAHVAATVKHFPGIGRATHNTDLSAVEIDPVATRSTAILHRFGPRVPACRS